MDKLYKNNIIQRSNKPHRFLIGGVRFGNQNVGDEAILEGVVNILRKVQPNCEITVLTDQPYRTAKQLRVKAFKYQFIAPRSGRVNRLFRMLSRIIENLLQAYLALRSDIVVCAGATILSDSPAMMLRLASWGIFANKRLVYFPGGMNPTNPPHILNKLLEISKEFDLFLVRDIDTKKRLVDAGFNPNFVQVTIDPAFNIELANDADNNITSILRINNKKNLVGIGISNEPDCSAHNQPLEWAKIADYIIKTFDANVIFLPSNTQEGKDLVIMKAAHRVMQCKDRAYIIDVELTPQDMVSAISKLEMMISSRMHQLFFSVMAETPFIGISSFVGVSRCTKTDSFLALFNLISAASARDCTLEKIRPSLELAWKQRGQLKKRIKTKKILLLDKASITERLFDDFLDSMNLSFKIHRPLLRRCRNFIDAFFMRL